MYQIMLFDVYVSLKKSSLSVVCRETDYKLTLFSFCLIEKNGIC